MKIRLCSARVRAALMAAAVQVGANPATGAAEELEKTVVTATRIAEPAASIPQAMTIIEHDEIQRQIALSGGDLGSVLGKLVPGLSVGNQSMSTYGQNLRGRKAAVLVDGVPQNPIFDPGKNLAVVDPAMIERIEIIRGATAIYGDGATGGIIHIVTRKPSATAMTQTTTVEAGLALTHPTDSLGAQLKHVASGRLDGVSYLLGAAAQKNGGWFDAGGDRIAPNPHRDGGLADTNQYDLLGKLGWDLSGSQSLAVELNALRNLQDTDVIADPAQRYAYAGAKARTVGGMHMDDPVGVRNVAGSIDYRHAALFGSALHMQIYGKDYWARSNPFDDFGTAVYQDTIESRKSGARIEIDTPMAADTLAVLWGLDVSHERIAQKVREMDLPLYESSGHLVYRRNGVERYWLNPYTQRSVAPFAQGRWRPSPGWNFHAGIRHERVDLDVPDFTTLGGKPIKGGTPGFGTTLFNAGAVRRFGEAVDVYVNFSQGFSLPDVRQKLRTGRGGTSVAQLNIEPEKVDHRELGVRGTWQSVAASLALYYDTSDLGANPPPNFNAPVARAPERLYGIEATLDWTFDERLKAGGTASWMEGKQDLANDAFGYVHLNNQRVRPPKLTAYLEHRSAGGWNHRLQWLVSGHRDRFSGSTAFAQRAVAGYATLDWLAEKRLGMGRLTVGIENLFNRLYYTPQSQQFLEGDVTHAAARGATLGASYAVNW